MSDEIYRIPEADRAPRLDCPFCGSADLTGYRTASHEDPERLVIRVLCRECGAMGPPAPLKGDQAIAVSDASRRWDGALPVEAEILPFPSQSR